jgi:signal transduction histidine kinase
MGDFMRDFTGGIDLLFLVLGLAIGFGIRRSNSKPNKVTPSASQNQNTVSQSPSISTQIDQNNLVPATEETTSAIVPENISDNISETQTTEIIPTPTEEKELSEYSNQLSDNTSDQLSNELSSKLQQTQLAYAMASEMSKFKGGFLARTSHELRSPLNSLIGTLQLITGDLCDSPEEEKEFIQQAYTAALKMVGLIDDLVFVSKVEHGTEKMDLQSLSLAKILSDVEDLTYLQAANRSIRLNFHIPDQEIMVWADERRLKQVLVSLIDGAIAQMDVGNIEITIENQPDNQTVNILIDDQRLLNSWSESWQLLEETAEKVDLDAIQLTPGGKLLVNQILLELMQGKLAILPVPTEKTDDIHTRTQCTLTCA